jgi:hypothetical protein
MRIIGLPRQWPAAGPSSWAEQSDGRPDCEAAHAASVLSWDATSAEHDLTKRPVHIG